MERSNICKKYKCDWLSALLLLLLACSMIEACNGAKFLVANADTSNILLYDAESGSQSLFVQSGPHLNHPDSMVYHPVTGELLVASGTDSSHSAVLRFNQFTGAFLGRFDNGAGPLDRPYGLTFTPDGKYLYAASFKTNKVLVYHQNGDFAGELPDSPLLNGPNALHFARDGLLYLTTEGAFHERGNISFPFKSQILRFDGRSWSIFVNDANPFGRPNSVASPNFLGLADSPHAQDNHLLFASDFANGILAFDLKTGNCVGRIETSYTGIPSSNALGSLVFEPPTADIPYSILTPGFEPGLDNVGCILRSTFNDTKTMSQARVSFFSKPNPGLVKPVTIKLHQPFAPKKQ